MYQKWAGKQRESLKGTDSGVHAGWSAKSDALVTSPHGYTKLTFTPRWPLQELREPSKGPQCQLLVLAKGKVVLNRISSVTPPPTPSCPASRCHLVRGGKNQVQTLNLKPSTRLVTVNPTAGKAARITAGPAITPSPASRGGVGSRMSPAEEQGRKGSPELCLRAQCQVCCSETQA